GPVLDRGARALVAEREPEPRIEACDLCEPSIDRLDVERRRREDRGIGKEPDRRSSTCRASERREAPRELALLVAHAPQLAVADVLDLEPAREEVDASDPHAEEPTHERRRSAFGAGTTSRVPAREISLERRAAGRIVGVRRNARSIIGTLEGAID